MEPYTKKKGRLPLSLLLVVSLSLGGGTIIITVFLRGGIIQSSLFTSYSLQMLGMMGTNMNGMQNMMTTQGQLVSVQQGIKMMHKTPSDTKVISNNNTIIFGSKDAKIVALAMMPERAVNLTGMKPPSYSKGDVFVIYGLINPTLVIPKGTSVQFDVINLDDDTYHNMLIPSVTPPYSDISMMPSTRMMLSNSQAGMQSNPSPAMTSFLSPVDHSSAHEYSYRLILDQSGSLWYMCTYPGHAQGMYGKILVTG